MRVAIYARISKEGDQSPDMQLVELKQYAHARNFTVVDTYVDAITGDVGKRKAPTFRYDDLLRDAALKKFDVVLVWKYDRFARTVKHLLLALENFKKLKIDFISYQEQIDTTTHYGLLFFHMVASFAQFERGMISERTKAGLRLAASRGVRLGAEEQVSQVVKDRIIRRYTNHATINAISKMEKMPMGTVYSILKRSICRLPCQHGKHRCKSCRKSSGVPKRPIAAENERALG